MPASLRLTKNIVAFEALFCLSLNVVGQSVSPRLVNIYGFDYQASDLIVSSAVGECAIKTIVNGESQITQGFLQPEVLQAIFCNDISLVYFPNPVEGQVTIQDVSCGSIITRVELYDTFGKLVLDTPLRRGSTDLQLVGLGMFIVRAYGVNDTYLDSFKLVKVTNN